MYPENHDNNEVVYAGSAGDDMPSDARVKESFDLELVKVGLPSYVDHYSRGVQRHPQVVADNGTFIVAWTDDVLPKCEIGGPDIRAKKLASDASDLGACGHEKDKCSSGPGDIAALEVTAFDNSLEQVHPAYRSD